VEAGKVSLDDPVSTHVDPLLLKLANTSIVGLWGATAGKVTVGHLLQMRSGIQDYDTYPPAYAFPSAFDLKLLLKEPDNTVTPVEFLEIPSIMPPGIPTFMFPPGQVHYLHYLQYLQSFAVCLWYDRSDALVATTRGPHRHTPTRGIIQVHPSHRPASLTLTHRHPP
jgi:hypothetical protein